MNERMQIVVRLPPAETRQIEALCDRFGMTRSRLVRKLIRDAHDRLPAKPVAPKPPEKLEKWRQRNRRSGLQKIEPPACETHEWEMLDDGTSQCTACGGVKT